MANEEYLVDTNVASELMKAKPHEKVISWLCDNSDSLRLSSVTVKELYFGALRMDEGRRKRALLASIENIVALYDADVFDFDKRAAIMCAKLHVYALKAGKMPTVEDLMIAATALTNNLVVATRNIKDFDYLGVRCVNPFE